MLCEPCTTLMVQGRAQEPSSDGVFRSWLTREILMYEDDEDEDE